MRRRNNSVFEGIKDELVKMIQLGIPVKIIAAKLGYTHNHLSSIMTRNDCSALEIRREYKEANPSPVYKDNEAHCKDERRGQLKRLAGMGMSVQGMANEFNTTYRDMARQLSELKVGVIVERNKLI